MDLVYHRDSIPSPVDGSIFANAISTNGNTLWHSCNPYNDMDKYSNVILNETSTSTDSRTYNCTPCIESASNRYALKCDTQDGVCIRLRMDISDTATSFQVLCVL